MTNYNHKFKKNLIADWIGRDLSAAIRGEVKTNLSAKTFVLSTVLASSLAFPALSQAGINLDGNPIEITGQKFEQDAENKDLTISIYNGQVGISAKQESDVELYDQSRFTDQYYTCLAS